MSSIADIYRPFFAALSTPTDRLSSVSLSAIQSGRAKRCTAESNRASDVAVLA